MLNDLWLSALKPVTFNRNLPSSKPTMSFIIDVFVFYVIFLYLKSPSFVSGISSEIYRVLLFFDSKWMHFSTGNDLVDRKTLTSGIKISFFQPEVTLSREMSLLAENRHMTLGPVKKSHFQTGSDVFPSMRRFRS